MRQPPPLPSRAHLLSLLLRGLAQLQRRCAGAAAGAQARRNA
jgi:hypothetical protein